MKLDILLKNNINSYNRQKITTESNLSVAMSNKKIDLSKMKTEDRKIYAIEKDRN